MKTDCSKLAKRPKLEEEPDTEKCHNSNTPGHDEEGVYLGGNMVNCPLK